MKIPNILTFLRLALIPIIAVFLYSNNRFLIIASILLFILSVSTDFADGFIARKYNQISVFGTFLDPLVDKMFILTILFILTDLKIIPLWMVLLILFRELLVTGVRQICSKAGKVVGANWMGKTKFVMQTLLILYLQFVLYFSLTNKNNILFNTNIAYYMTLTVTIISLAFAFCFLYLHRKIILSEI